MLSAEQVNQAVKFSSNIFDEWESEIDFRVVFEPEVRCRRQIQKRVNNLKLLKSKSISFNSAIFAIDCLHVSVNTCTYKYTNTNV